MTDRPAEFAAIRFPGNDIVEASARFAASSPWFSGHFPDRPILPAVAILSLAWDAAQALAARTGERLLVRQWKKVRFRRTVQPEEQLELTARLHRAEHRIEFDIRVGDEFVSSGEARVEFETLADFALPSPANPFVLGGATVGAVYALAEKLLAAAPTGDGPRAACVLTPDKAVVAAAVVAALAGPLDALLPPAPDDRVINDLRDDPAIALAVVDRPLAAAPWRVVELSPTAETRPAPPLRRDPDAPFLFLQTGGSTGAPARWSKTPHNLAREVLLLIEKYDIGPEDVILSTVPPQHIYGLLFTILLPLFSGARVVDEIVAFPQEIADGLAEHEATVLAASPAHYRALRRTPIVAPRLRRAFSSGGMLDEDDARIFFERTGVGVVEVYGSTETGGVATRCRAAGEQYWRAHAAVPWKIVDERFCVASPFVSPEAPRDADGFFRSGDRAEPGPDGTFILHGRADGVVKVSGNRVDLAEVEEKIRVLPGVADACVLARPCAAPRENEIVALVVGNITEAELRARLAERLAPYALPRAIRFADAIPLASAGKRDRAAVLRLFTK